MSEQEVRPLEGKIIHCKSRKLFKPVTGRFHTFYCGVIIIRSELGIYGIYPHDLEYIVPA